MSQKLHPNGFRISDVPVAASFAQTESFQPVDAMLRDEASIKSSSSLGGGDGFFVRYWDESSSVAVLEFKVDLPTQSISTGKEKEKKKKAKGMFRFASCMLQYLIVDSYRFAQSCGSTSPVALAHL